MSRTESDRHPAAPVFACLPLALAGLRLPAWTLPPGSCTGILGGNGAGKTRLARLLAGELTVPAPHRITHRPESVAWVSQESQQTFYEDQLRLDESDLTDIPDTGTPVADLLQAVARDLTQVPRIQQALGLTPLQDRGYRLLSSGEGRRVMLARALLEQPELLILEAPFEGIDAHSVRTLKTALPDLLPTGTTLLLLLGHRHDLPTWVNHLGLLADGELVTFGPAESVAAEPAWQHAADLAAAPVPELPAGRSEFQLSDWPRDRPLLSLRAGRVSYDDVTQFGPLDWTLRPGEHTQILGPNGSGKSTLLHLVTGDHPQCYVNDLTVFGYQRGSGESIWDIKRHLGYVSNDLHRNYRVHDNALTTVATGLTDSIGLYRAVGDEEIRLAHSWLELIGLSGRGAVPFRALSAGEQRLILIARALIKQPPLLLLDEPTQGLDDLNRFRVLRVIENLVRAGQSTLVFVSHRPDETLSIIQHQLVFEPSEKPGCRFDVRQATTL